MVNISGGDVQIFCTRCGSQEWGSMGVGGVRFCASCGAPMAGEPLETPYGSEGQRSGVLSAVKRNRRLSVAVAFAVAVLLVVGLVLALTLPGGGGGIYGTYYAEGITASDSSDFYYVIRPDGTFSRRFTDPGGEGFVTYTENGIHSLNGKKITLRYADDVEKGDIESGKLTIDDEVYRKISGGTPRWDTSEKVEEYKR